MYHYIDAVNEEEALHPEWGYSEHLLKITYDKFPYRMEDPLKMFERGLQLRRFFNQYMKAHPLEGQQKCVIVSHSAFLTSLSAKGYSKEGLVEAEHMHNCQFIPWQSRSLEI